MRLAQAKVHFVGIGGIGMCGLAELLARMGAKVSGSDLAENANTKYLQGLGVTVFYGHNESNITDSDVVVYSSAIKSSNPEIMAAKAKRVPLIARAEALAEIMRLKRGIAVGGTHGKTTTTSMLASVFIHAGLEPTVFVGGRFDLIKSTARLGSGEWMIAEADESDGSFSKLSPEIVVVTNIDNDHMDFYKSEQELHKAFLKYAELVPFYGVAVVCGDDPVVRKVFADFPKAILTYGFSADNDLVISGSNRNFRVEFQNRFLGEISLQLPGKHNARNACAAILVGLRAGISFSEIARGLNEFRGVDRRFQLKGHVHEKPIYDDYGHHPTEIKAVLEAFREKFSKEKLLVVFQPHRYSRTQICWDQFLDSFKDADEVLILDIYPAGEKPIDGVDSKSLVSQIQHPYVKYLPRDEKMLAKIQERFSENQVLITLGAGDVNKIGPDLLDRMK